MLRLQENARSEEALGPECPLDAVVTVDHLRTVVKAAVNNP
jgi:hypothetical protein